MVVIPVTVLPLAPCKAGTTPSSCTQRRGGLSGTILYRGNCEFSLKSECPCPRKESGKVKVGGKSHIMVYLAEKFGRPGLSPSSPFAVSESRTQHPHSRKTELTMIRETANSHNWTQDLLSGLSRGRDSGAAGLAQQGKFPRLKKQMLPT